MYCTSLLSTVFNFSFWFATRRYGARSSSAHWDADQMTLVEKRVYRKHMGYDRALQQQQQAAAAQASK